MKNLILSGVFFCAVFSCAGAYAAFEVPPEAKGVKNPVTSDEISVGKGKAIFAKSCVSCHGASAKGSGAAPDLTVRLKGQTDGEIFWKITNGSKPPTMPKYKKILGDEDRWNLVNYLKTLAK